MKAANRALVMIIAAALVCLLVVPFLGATLIAPSEIMDITTPDYLIFWRLRFPRCLGAFLAGAGLSICGLAFQALFRNPLATPFTLGVSSGAALGGGLYARIGAMAGFLGSAGSLIFSLAGCFTALSAVYLITRSQGGFSTTVLLLAGVIISFLFSSLVMFVQYVSNAQDAVQIMRWLMGTLAGIRPMRLIELACALAGGYWILSKITVELDLLMTGEELAASRGVDVERVKLLVFITASVVVGVIVSVAGPIGFVGMMIPQICRLLLGSSHCLLLPASFFMGGGFLVLCDLLARSLLAPAELPVGIVTSMLGAPFFLWTLFRGRKAGEFY